MTLKHNLGKLLVSGGLFIAVNGYSAVDSEVRVETSGRWIDNVYFASDEQRNDVLGTAKLQLSLNSVDEVTEFDLGYEISHENYLRDSFGNENYIQGVGSLNVNLLPHRLVWISNIQSEITRRDSIGVDVPTNKDQRNFAQTGLEYFLLSGVRDSVSISPSVSVTRFRAADFNNNNRGLLELNWRHALSRLTDSGFNCEAEKVDFTEADGDYDTARCNVAYGRRLSNGSIAADIGKRWINPAVGDTIDGLAYTIGVEWEQVKHNFNLYAVRDILDNTDSLGGGGFVGTSSPVEVNTDIRSLTVRKRVELQYDYLHSRADQIGFRVYQDAEDLYESNADTDRVGSAISYRRSISPQLLALFRYSFEKIAFADGTPDEVVDYEDFYLIEMRKEFSRQLEVYWSLESELRRAKLAERDYEVYSVEMGIAYTF